MPEKAILYWSTGTDAFQEELIKLFPKKAKFRNCQKGITKVYELLDTWIKCFIFKKKKELMKLGN